MRIRNPQERIEPSGLMPQHHLHTKLSQDSPNPSRRRRKRLRQDGKKKGLFGQQSISLCQVRADTHAHTRTHTCTAQAHTHTHAGTKYCQEESSGDQSRGKGAGTSGEGRERGPVRREGSGDQWGGNGAGTRRHRYPFVAWVPGDESEDVAVNRVFLLCVLSEYKAVMNAIKQVPSCHQEGSAVKCLEGDARCTK